MPVATLQVANPAIGTVSRQPQTTSAPGGTTDVPFARVSRHMQILGPQQAGLAFGALWTPILKPVGGYLRYLQLPITSAGSTLVGGAVGTGDAPWSCIQNLFLRDPFGQPILQADGYSLMLINMYGSQCGMLGFGNVPAALPSFSFTAGQIAAGNFTLSLQIPLEMDAAGFCALPSMNASSQPQLQLQFNTLAATYANGVTPAGGGGVAPLITVSADEPYWGAPVDRPELAPPDVGSSAQWSVARAQSTVTAGAYQRLILPRVGTWMHCLIMVLRDAAGARIDAWPTTDLQLWVDGVPIMFETLAERTDRMFTQFGVARPIGVLVYTFRNSIMPAVSQADNYDLLLPTTPATLLEIGGTFGAIPAGPGNLFVISGELFPLGGIPYTHLAQ